ncbi:MAG: sigma-54-dependent Fis family transcriptional regulator [Nannocystaceae bacterium]|nr:sigma-54-dependent Fis family transcriptional regulator [Nannocystaceae bacterium]
MLDGQERLRSERDLYRQCLELCDAEDPAPLLQRTISLLREIAGAAHGYIELSDTSAEPARTWWAATGVGQDELEVIRSRVSSGVVAEAIATETVVHVPSALLDERFGDRESVRAAEIGAVLCVPLSGAGVSGVLYLQDHLDGDAGGRRFSTQDVESLETVARFVGTLAGQMAELLRRRERQDATAPFRSRLQLNGLIGRSPALAETLARIEVLATMEANVLLVGASGTGKSLLAKLLHDNSRRKSAPFVAINCAALPEPLVESELFGADRGAHSGVSASGIDGKVSAAEGGTLFLDEVGELSPPVQAKLLQFLQSKQYYRLGGTQPQSADVRIVAASNRDLQSGLKDGWFREDLYYRLRGVELAMPSLAERPEDLPLLASHFVNLACDSNGLPRMRVSVAAMGAISVSDWPGNVRQLANKCEEAVVSARIEGATTIELRHMFPQPREETPDQRTTFQQFRDLRDRQFLAGALEAESWNVSRTARALELSRSHLNSLIRRFGLQRNAGH